MTSASPDDSEWRFPNRATPLGSAHYYAVRFSPAAERERNARLIAWYQMVQAVADRPQDPGVARLKLHWWREEITKLGSGTARHPLVIELQQAGLGSAAVAPMHAIVATVKDEVFSPQVMDDTEFMRACHGSLGRLFELLATLDPDKGHDGRYCRQAGAYCAAIERIRCAAQLPHRVPGDLRPGVADGLSARQRQARCAGLLDGLRVEPRQSAARLPDLARRLSALADAMHRKMRRKGYPLTDTPIDRAPIAKLWTAWRCR